jgi:hypothetical protein
LKANKYAWELEDGRVLDPTNANGDLLQELDYFGIFKVGTALALINEPPVGKDVNIIVKVNGENIQFIAERDIGKNGKKLYIILLK